MTYIDLNMVRAGAISHPEQWETSAYREIQDPPKRYRVIDYSALMNLLGIPDLTALQRTHHRWIEEALKAEQSVHDEHWSQSLAIGSQTFVSQFQARLGAGALHRSIEEHGDSHVLREEIGCNNLNSGGKIAALTGDNVVFLDGSV